MQQHEIGVQHHVARVLVRQHVGRVLGDAGCDEVELAALRPELREVLDDRGVPEERLHLVDVEPRSHAALVIRVHAVSHGLQRGEHSEHAHAARQLVEVDVDDALAEGDVALAVEERERPAHVALVA